MKILKINGHKYSKSKFEGYSVRYKLRITTVKETFELDIYSTDTDVQSVENVMLNGKSAEVTSIHFFHTATKRQDDLASELIDEVLPIL